MSRNPFNRPMFNNPNMNQISSGAPLGILASSPDLMASARRGMARKMQSGFGTHMNVPTVTQDQLNTQFAAIQGLSDQASKGSQEAVNALRNIVADNSMPTETRVAANQVLNRMDSTAVDDATVKLRNVNALEKTLAPVVQRFEDLGTSAKEAGIAGAFGAGRQVLSPALEGLATPDAPAPDQESAVQRIARTTGVGATKLAGAIKSGIGAVKGVPGAVSDALFEEKETPTGQANRLLAEKTAELDATINKARNTALPSVPKTEAETIAETVAPPVVETSTDDQEVIEPEVASTASESASEAPVVVESEDLVTTPDTPKLTSTLNDPDISPKQKAKAVDDALGLESVADRKEFLKGLLGERAKDIRTDANYNLMMTGLLIAAGDDSNALANIAKGAASGLAGFGKAVGEEAQADTEEDRALTLQAYEDVRGEEAARIAAERAALEAELGRDATKDLTKMQLQARLDLAEMQDDTRRDIAEQARKSAEMIALSPGREYQGLLQVFGSKEGVRNYYEAQLLAKTVLKQGTTLRGQVENFLNNSSLLEIFVDDMEKKNIPVTGEGLVNQAIAMAESIPEGDGQTASGFSLPNQQ